MTSQTLKIELPRAESGSRSRWADRKTSLVEDRLPEILEGFASRAAEDRECTAIEARQAAEREHARKKAKTDTHSKAVQHFYAETLHQQMASFECTWAISAYCDAFEQRIAAADPTLPDRESALQWLEWARKYAAELDPLQHLPTMPAAPSSPLSSWRTRS